MSLYDFKIITASEDHTATETPLLATVQALTGATTQTFSVLGIYARYVFETEEKTSACGRTANSLTRYLEYRVEFGLHNLPTTATAMATHFPELTKVTEQFMWIYSSDYVLDFTVANQTRAVYVVGNPEENRKTNSLTGYIITFRTRKPV